MIDSSSVAVILPQPPALQLDQMVLPRQHTRILRGKDIVAAVGYEFGVAGLNLFVFMIAAAATLPVYIAAGALTVSYWKIMGSLFGTAGVMFGVTAISLSLLDILRGKNHLKNITNAEAYALAKTDDIDYSVLITAVMRALGAIGLCNLLGDVFGNYVFSLSNAEFLAFSLIMAKSPWATATVAVVLGVPGALIYAQTDSKFNRQNRRLRGLISAAYSRMIPAGPSGTPAVIAPRFADSRHISALPYHNGHTVLGAASDETHMVTEAAQVYHHSSAYSPVPAFPIV